MSSVAVFWLVLVIILGIIEAATPTLVCIWPAIGGLISLILALCGFPLWLQIAVFIGSTVILVILTRPFAKKYVSQKTIATNADRIIGAEGKVIQKIDPIENIGQIKVLGQIWSAKSADGEVIQPNAQVIITALEGVKAVVKSKY